MNCKNCNAETSQNFCSNCGAPVKLKRIDRHYIQHEIEHLLHFEKGFLYTIKELVTRPGQSVRTFISDNRTKLVKPILFIILSSLLYSLTTHFFHIEDGYMKYGNTEANSTTLIFKWIQEHYGYSNIIMAIFIAMWIKIFFRKYNYNFFEILILLCFVMGIGMLIFALFAMIEGVSNIQLMQISGIISFIYSAWAIGQFFDKYKWINYLKSFFAYLLGFMTFGISALMLGIAIDLIIKH